MMEAKDRQAAAATYCIGVVLILCTLASVAGGLASEATTPEPSFDVPSVNVTVKEGMTAILPCSVKHLGKHQVIWTDQWSTLLTFTERRIIDDERVSVERPYTKDWNLHVRDVRYSDQGLYNCQINTSPVKIKTVILNVQVPAKIIGHLSSEDMKVQEGETVTLVCNVTGIPMPKVTWYRHTAKEKGVEKEILSGVTEIGANGEVLMIHNVSRYCGDLYECVAFNGVPPAVNRIIRVDVEFPPEVRLPNKRIGQFVGKDTILECVVTALPQAVSVWMRNGEEIQSSNRYRLEVYEEGSNTITLSLKIQMLDSPDFGEYECMASNRLGKDSETMILYDYAQHRSTTQAPPTYPPSTQTVYIENMPPRPPLYPTEHHHQSKKPAGSHVSFVTHNPPEFYKPRDNHINAASDPTGRTLEINHPDSSSTTCVASVLISLMGATFSLAVASMTS